MSKNIDPKQLMQELSVEALCQTAEDYYARLHNHTSHMAKPFTSTKEAPDLLYNMGLLLSGLHLGKSMVVLDFGAGTCWFSRLLNQMQCVTISVDPSPTALEIGRKLFEVSPIVGQSLHPPRFLHFDGYTINLENESVDRIISFSAFHHVPNQEQVLKEFYRVLKPGGIVGFSEPGRNHSQSPQSQFEMRHFTVLENDILLEEIKAITEKLGFSEMRIKLVTSHTDDLSYRDYRKIIWWRWLSRRVWRQIIPAMQNNTVFFLTKGTYQQDSRSHEGLRHSITILQHDKTASVGQPYHITVRLKNSGQSKWLHQNIADIGVVKVGVHLHDHRGQLLNLDFARSRLLEDVPPGAVVDNQFQVLFTQPGNYQLTVDLVAEQVTWFEGIGSQPQKLSVQVT